MYNVLIKRHVAAFNIDALNRAAKCVDDVPNGGIMVLNGKSTEEGESRVWVAEAPADNTVKGVWMAASPEVVTLKDALGNKFKGLTVDPRAFVNNAGDVMDVFQPKKGDIIWIAPTDVVGTIDATNKYLVATGGAYTMTATSTEGDGFCLKLIGERDINIPDGNIVRNFVKGYEFEVVNN